MEQKQKEQMIEALYEAFKWKLKHGDWHGIACVMLDGDNITWGILQNVDYYKIIVRVWSIRFMLGDRWADGVDIDNEEAVEAVLYAGAVDWVEKFGEDALEIARQ